MTSRDGPRATMMMTTRLTTTVMGDVVRTHSDSDGGRAVGCDQTGVVTVVGTKVRVMTMASLAIARCMGAKRGVNGGPTCR
jgi:hypothetical protein